MPRLTPNSKRSLKPGKVVRFKTQSNLTIKAFEEGKDNPDHILGIARKDYFNYGLYVIDRTTGIRIYIIEEDAKTNT